MTTLVPATYSAAHTAFLAILWTGIGVAAGLMLFFMVCVITDAHSGMNIDGDAVLSAVIVGVIIIVLCILVNIGLASYMAGLTVHVRGG